MPLFNATELSQLYQVELVLRYVHAAAAAAPAAAAAAVAAGRRLLLLQAVGYQHVDFCLLLVRQFGQLQQELEYLQHITRVPMTCLTPGWT